MDEQQVWSSDSYYLGLLLIVSYVKYTRTRTFTEQCQFQAEYCNYSAMQTNTNILKPRIRATHSARSIR